MPQPLTYPGVYIEEVPSGVRTIVGVATSVTAFIGRTKKGPTDRAVLVLSYAQFVDELGGLWDQSRLGFSVRDFYLNGGKQALLCRVYAAPPGADGRARISFGNGDKKVAVVAVSPGEWGNSLRVVVDHTGLPGSGEAFNLVVTVKGGRSERFAGVSLYTDRTRNVRDVIETESALVRWDDTAAPLLAPPQQGASRTGPDDGSDGASVKEKALADATGTTTVALRDANTAAAAATQADEAKQQADAKVQAAQAAEAASKAKLDDATAARVAAAALDQTVPANQQTLADATAAEAAAKTVHDADTQKVADATAAQTAAAAAATVAQQQAATAKTAADQAKAAADQAKQDAAAAASFGGDDGGEVTADALETQAGPLLERVDLFNILCIPPYKADGADVEPAVFDWAAGLCSRRRALLLVDPPSNWTSPNAAADGFRAEADVLGGRSSNGAVYFPRLRQPNPLKGDVVEEFVPCGAVAGVMARTDAERGVWKAPAGLEATLRGVPDLTVRLSDDENGLLNPLGVNCLRAMPAVGRVVWGARTLVGADVLASDWKYVPVRRLALYIEESLFRGTQWVVFEPNDEPLWAQVRLSVGSFMHQLFRQGAFQGRSPRDAYFVKCDGDTTTQADRNLGVVNIHVGFAPLKPAEFVVIRLQQLAGQIEV